MNFIIHFMKYFIDFEFLEGDVPNTLFGINIPKSIIKPNNTINPISVGISCEDGREYYAISKDFNLKEAWNRYDMKQESCPITGVKTGRLVKDYWLRDNVLRAIWRENGNLQQHFTYLGMKFIITNIGKSNKQIAEEVISFIYPDYYKQYNKDTNNVTINRHDNGVWVNQIYEKPEFYAYYGDYDWVVFCWLFGKMIDLPKGFPCYAKDLQQIFDEKKSLVKGRMKDQPGFPVNKGIHNALEDAKWNFELFKFLNTI